MQIRPATPADIPQICDIWNDIIRNTAITFTTQLKTVESLEEALQKQFPFIVATQDNRVLGFATYGPFRNGPGYKDTVELSINLAAQARGQKVGTRLLQNLQTEAQNNQIHAMIAGISGENKGAIKFHKANGFTLVGTLPEVGKKFERRLDLVLMQKLL